MLENVRPMDIERRSFEIITELLGDRQPAPEIAPVVKRVIHTTADFDYAENLVFSPGAVERGMEALRAGCDIVTDTQMAKAGVNKTILAGASPGRRCPWSGRRPWGSGASSPLATPQPPCWPWRS